VSESPGILVAAIIRIQDYEQYRRLLAQEYHQRPDRKVGAAVKAQALTEEQLIADMEEDRQAVYEEMYGNKWNRFSKALK
jgi:hypothetical protein